MEEEGVGREPLSGELVCLLHALKILCRVFTSVYVVDFEVRNHLNLTQSIKNPLEPLKGCFYNHLLSIAFPVNTLCEKLGFLS